MYIYIYIYILAVCVCVCAYISLSLYIYIYICTYTHHLAPDELAAHALLDHGVEREGEGVEVLRLHVGAQDAYTISV